VPTPTPAPTGREQEILKVLWDLGPSSVKEVHRELQELNEEDEDLAYNTVQTLLRLMEDKGLVSHHVDGRTFVYSPRYSREQSAVRFLDRVFDGAASQLMLSLLKAERIPPDELERMYALIDQARKHRPRDGRLDHGRLGP
jgi:BlaI family transcriptional regulator, penicillinase repressor